MGRSVLVKRTWLHVVSVVFSKAVVPSMEAFPAGQHGVRSRRTLALSQEVSSIVRLVCVCERTVGTVVRIVPAIFVCCQAGAR